jgi:DNA primase
LPIEQSVIEEIRLRCNIEEVVSGYVTLKRAGANYVGLCPFHSEKSPSFTVFVDSANFYCFGCGAGGDVITFIRRAENLDYPSAVEFLARRAGISVTMTKSERSANLARERTIAMNREAARYFHYILLNTPQGKIGLDYLQSRGLSISLIRHFGLGFSPDDPTSLPSYLSSKGYTDAEMASGYLSRYSEKSGRIYGLFRNRVIFPILSAAGDVIGFGGRVMDDSKPKYLNTSDTPAFNKRKNLFALNFAKANCAQQMILCEGYMDVIALHGAGFTNAVATLGTAITPDQARIFKRYTKSVIICYDADEAGQNAASKAFRLLGEVGVDCKILKVKNAKDPDEYIRKYGAASFKKLLEGSRTEFEFRYDKILSENRIGQPDETSEDKLKAVDQAVELISEDSSAARRDMHIFDVAQQFQITPDAIRRDVEKKIHKKTALEKKEKTVRMISQTAGYGDRVNLDAVKNPRASGAEEAILGIFLLHPEYITELKNKDKLPSVEDFFTAFGKKVYSLILEQWDGEVFHESVLGESLSPDEMSRLVKMKLARQRLTRNTVEVLLECYHTLLESTSQNTLDIDDILSQKREKNGKADRI